MQHDRNIMLQIKSIRIKTLKTSADISNILKEMKENSLFQNVPDRSKLTLWPHYESKSIFEASVGRCHQSFLTNESYYAIDQLIDENIHKILDDNNKS